MNQTTKKRTAVVIGAGFSGLAAASYLAREGVEVTVLEKHNIAGGRARVMQREGFTFDMGPSWYWMPDVFESFFSDFGRSVHDFYSLQRLDPSYAIFFSKNHRMDVPAGMDEIYGMFETYEPGSSSVLKRFLDEARYKYETGLGEFVHKPGHSILEFADSRILLSLFRLQMFSSIGKQIHSKFKNPFLRKLLEFPVLFLGATPAKTPALYSLMNYADMCLGTWYPMGGMYRIVEAMESVAREQGVNFCFNHEVTGIKAGNGKVYEVDTSRRSFKADIYVASADYRHVDQQLLPPGYRNYSARYWDKRVMAPSSLLFYLGIKNKELSLKHHNLFFDEDFAQHAQEIYDNPQWPGKPLFYVCAPSVTDPTVAPEGHENLFILIPLAPGLTGDTEDVREKYFNLVMDRLENITGSHVREHIVFKQSFGVSNFINEYHAWKGNAYGLANTLSQTAFLKPKMRHKKLGNLLFAGQLTTPGPGVPPSLISGKVAALESLKYLNH